MLLVLVLVPVLQVGYHKQLEAVFATMHGEWDKAEQQWVFPVSMYKHVMASLADGRLRHRGVDITLNQVWARTAGKGGGHRSQGGASWLRSLVPLHSACVSHVGRRMCVMAGSVLTLPTAKRPGMCMLCFEPQTRVCEPGRSWALPRLCCACWRRPPAV